VPEGDTILRTAQTLHAALAGRSVTAFESALPAVSQRAQGAGLVGQRVAGVEANGKHLLLRFEGGVTLHTHLGMRGSWHLYRTSSRWRKPRTSARIVLTADGVVAVCFAPMLAELLTPAELRKNLRLTRLGPDALAAGFDPAQAVTRLRARADLEVGVALVDQKALAGVGNIHKSEALFLCGVNPFARVEALADATLVRVVRTAAEQLRRGAERPERKGSPPLAPGTLYVYGRGGEPCRRCGETVRRAYQGLMRRSTYWCPRCQPAEVEPQPPPVPA
jgi:endonuclease-8